MQVRNASATNGCSVTHEDIQGPLSSQIGGFYTEYLISNLTPEDIVILDNLHGKCIIHGNYQQTAYNQRVIIERRAHVGMREFDPYRNEKTKTRKIISTIKFSSIVEGPIFLEDVNLVICLRSHADYISHPHFKENTANKITKALTASFENSNYFPIAIVGNDPTGIISTLYTEIHDHICACKINNFSTDDEDDVLVIMYRDLSVDNKLMCSEIKTTFTELRKNKNLVWKIGNAWFSTSREILKTHVDSLKREEAHSSISIEEHKSILDRDVAFQLTQNGILKTENKQLKDTVAALENIIQSGQTNAVAEHKVQAQLEQLRLERLSISVKQDQLKADAIAHSRSLKYKRKAEQLATITSGLKLATVAIPAAITIFKVAQMLKR